jgi:hypothetical protein
MEADGVGMIDRRPSTISRNGRCIAWSTWDRARRGGWGRVLVQTAFPIELSLGNDGLEVNQAFLELFERSKQPLGLR